MKMKKYFSSTARRMLLCPRATSSKNMEKSTSDLYK
jgi:hypothetical protein